MLAITKENFDSEVLCRQGRVLVVFSAPWCGECNALHPILADAEQEATDVAFAAVDCDTERDLAMRCGVMALPTLLLFENGSVIDKSVGLAEKETVLRMISA